MPDIFTQVVGTWHRTAVRDLPAGAGIEQLRTASYQGPGTLEASIYRLTSPAMALDMAQRWKPTPDTVFFYSDRFFVLVRWQTADRKALHEFVAALEKRLRVR
jgi:hypothetical protein